ncbi:MAG: magnesium transporter [Chloroflexi bacterium]|nr:magnesium transporter [Chloroflexota bacterium]
MSDTTQVAEMLQVVALATSLPVIAGQGGIAGTQMLALIIRSITLGEVSPSNTSQLLFKEISIGLVHGLARTSSWRSCVHL